MILLQRGTQKSSPPIYCYEYRITNMDSTWIAKKVFHHEGGTNLLNQFNHLLQILLRRKLNIPHLTTKLHLLSKSDLRIELDSPMGLPENPAFLPRLVLGHESFFEDSIALELDVEDSEFHLLGTLMEFFKKKGLTTFLVQEKDQKPIFYILDDKNPFHVFEDIEVEKKKEDKMEHTLFIAEPKNLNLPFYIQDLYGKNLDYLISCHLNSSFSSVWVDSVEIKKFPPYHLFYSRKRRGLVLLHEEDGKALPVNPQSSIFCSVMEKIYAEMEFPTVTTKNFEAHENLYKTLYKQQASPVLLGEDEDEDEDDYEDEEDELEEEDDDDEIEIRHLRKGA